MYAIMFQLAGSMVLALMVMTRSKKEICYLSKVVIRDNTSLPEGAKRLLLETWLSRFGFGYLFIGYLLQQYVVPLPMGVCEILQIKSIPYISFVFFIVLAYVMSKYLVKIQTPSLEDEYKKPVHGQLRID